jgi:HTH-type transcriptional regulator / antitoxin HigA
MAERVDYRFVPDVAIPPGETIGEILDERGITQADFALMLGRTEKNVSQLINGKAPISHELAIDLERVLGVPAALWNNLEAVYRDLLARQREDKDVEREAAWAKGFPLQRLKEDGFIARETGPAEQSSQLLEFFGVASPEAWLQYWSSPRRLAARVSGAYATDVPALTAWLRLGELAAREMEILPFDRRGFATVVCEARTLTREPVQTAFATLRNRSAECGVAVVLVQELPKIRCHGVTRWISDETALIQLCLRYKTTDQFWFSFFHEACHVLKHSRKRTYIEDIADRSVEEGEANAFAADTLIPPTAWQAFLGGGRPTKASVRAFAAEQGIAPGIVVGRLQHEQVIPFEQMNELKTKVHWAVG